MSEINVLIENVSKQYRLGEVGSSTLKDDFNRWWAKMRGKENPYAIIGEENERTIKGSSEYVWALKNINLEIKKGEVVGIIGRNGSGKSTLLKILSRVTAPTTGKVRIKGRIASLLEVGTGFHPELTGRENIFLNGAILGMTKEEIRRKFDNIVDFAGVKRFIDTPVKRYSSGMYVRLAFAVAAHLDPEILIVDEVLSVGDAEFQKKSLGKMKDVSTQEGRTILFVSHNMQAVSSLCSKVIWLQNGRLVASGTPKTIINSYLNVIQNKERKKEWSSLAEAPGNEFIKMLSVELSSLLPDPQAPIDIRTPLSVKFRFLNSVNHLNLTIGLVLFTLAGECIFDVPYFSNDALDPGVIEGECTIPGNFLNDGAYYFSISFVKDTTQELFYFDECLHFDVEDYRENTSWYEKWWGYVRPKFPFTLKRIEPLDH